MTNLSCGLWDKGLVKLEHRELRRIEQLVAELAVSLNTENLEIDIVS